MALSEVVKPFGESRTLPATAYTSTAVFDWDLEHFFDEAWVCVGREEELAAGSVTERRAGKESILLSSPGDGQLAAHFNVCRHRGHELLSGGERALSLSCPYHGWSYRLDGTLRSAPRFGDTIEASDFELIPVRLEVWEGWVFVNVAGDAPELANYLGNLADLVGPYRPAELRIGARLAYEPAANWKLLCENYHECYHCSVIHPELCEVTPPDSGTNLSPTGAWIGGTMDLRPGVDTMSFDGSSPLEPLPGLDPFRKRTVGYFGGFPNLFLSLHPDYVMTHRLEPLAPGATRIVCEFLFPAEQVADSGFDVGFATEFWDLVNRQDWAACEAVQRGAASKGHRAGPLAPNEDAVYQFLALVGRSYAAGRLVLPPPPAQHR